MEPDWEKLSEKARDIHPEGAIPWGTREGEFQCCFCGEIIQEAAVFVCPTGRDLVPMYLCPDSDSCDLRAAVSDV